MERHSGNGHELVSALDAPVLQMVDQFVDVLQFFCAPVVAEQVIGVAKILLEDSIPQRSMLCEPQLAEQLVEVPTVVSHFLQQQFAEQNVDIPVPVARGWLDGGGLQDFSPEQGSRELLDAPQEHFQGVFALKVCKHRLASVSRLLTVLAAAIS